MNNLIERLEQEIKHYDRRVVASLSDSYDQRGADLRDLLIAARDEILWRQWADRD